MTNAIGYVRVSTAEQGKSGLGLEAQKAAIEAFAQREGFVVSTYFTEVQSGKRISDTLNERPQLLGVFTWEYRKAGSLTDLRI